MLPNNTLGWGTARRCIRELFEYGLARKAVVGEENVYDFSLGNPSIPAPNCVNETIARLLTGDSVALHGYTSAAGRPTLRKKIAEDLNARFGTGLDMSDIYVTCGAAAGLASALRGLVLPGEEVVALAPFFPEYRVFAEAAGGTLVTVPPRKPDFQLDIAAFTAALTEKTKVVIVNSPNNPSGVVLSAESLRALSAALSEAQSKYGTTIYLLCDEPYRELVYDGLQVPCVLNFYPNTVLCYSFSKSLSIPGERIGYLAVSDKMAGRGEVFASIAGAARALGYVNAPSLLQQVIEACLGATADVSAYRENRDLIYNALTALGFDCVHPDGAFYLFMRSPEPDSKAFSEKARAHELLLVPADDFGCPGYVRISYCVSKDMIQRSIPAFAALAKEYSL